MANIKTLIQIVNTLNRNGYPFYAEEIEKEILKRKENSHKQKEKRQRISKDFNNKILKVIKESRGDLSANDIVNGLEKKGITKNPITNRPITARSISIRCSDMCYDGIVSCRTETRQVIVNKKIPVYY